MNGFVVGLEITNGAYGYSTPPVVRIEGGGGTGAAATANIIEGGWVTGYTITNPGSGYTSVPTVIIGDLPFSIITQPTTRLVILGGDATLLVEASGEGPFTYQWFLNGIPLAGATEQALSISVIDHSKTGKYTVVVTGPGGSLTSSPATLVSDPGLNLNIYAGLTLDGTVGQTYTIEYTPDLQNNTLWKMLDQVTLTNSPQLWFDLGSSSSAKRFYRATPVF